MFQQSYVVVLTCALFRGGWAKSVLANIRIILVETTHSGNIGAAARAMKTMGLSQLVLVAPKEYPSPEAEWMATNAQDVLQNARVVSTLTEAVEGCGLVIGTSARQRRIPWPLLEARECGEKLWGESTQHEVALVFGREDRGLTNEELQLCHFHVHIPGNPDYSVLNIASAVQVLAYEIYQSYRASQRPDNFQAPQWGVSWDEAFATADEMEKFFVHLETTLVDIGFYDPADPRQLMKRLRRLYMRARPDRVEMKILRGMLSDTQRVVGTKKSNRVSNENKQKKLDE